MKKKSILPFFEAWDLNSLASFEDLIYSFVGSDSLHSPLQLGESNPRFLGWMLELSRPKYMINSVYPWTPTTHGKMKGFTPPKMGSYNP